MQAREHLEEVAVLRRRIRHARVPQQEGEDRGEGGPEDHRSEQRRDARTVRPFHEHRHDEVRLRARSGRDEVPPRHHADNRQIDRDVDDCDQDGADEDRSRDHPAGVLDFVTDIAHIVIPEVVVDADA